MKMALCIDMERCEEKLNGICLKCKDDESIINGYYWGNEIYGCLKTFIHRCKQCKNLEDLYTCTECHEGYNLNEYKRCFREIENEEEEEK